MVEQEAASHGVASSRTDERDSHDKIGNYASDNYFDHARSQDHAVTKVRSNGSSDTLPLYDENSSPAYEEELLSTSDNRATDVARRPARPPVLRSWSTQLMISTSGLGIALSDGSLGSLKYCLGTLRNANKHVWSLMEALKRLLQDYERSSHEGARQDGDVRMRESGTSREDPTMVARRIKQLTDEIWQTVQKVVTTVSSYAGGALPENASAVVRWQLMSVPRRWARAVAHSSQSDDAVSGAHRMLAFATEGLDMMEQVGGVVDKTIQSAEKWLDSMGRKRQDGEDALVEAKKDVEMDEAPDVEMGQE